VDCIDVFTRPYNCVIECLNFCVKNKGIILYSYVIIMSNHIHLIVQSENGQLSDLIRDFKNLLPNQF
jgi:REP element-mobilizing transposase RayT